MMPSKSNYYADAEPPAASGPADQPTEKEEPQEGDTTDAQTAELPKTVLGGKEFKPGEEVMLEIVQVMENSVLVKYASEKGGEEEGGGESAPESSGGNPGGNYY
jgi:hypothetical protein